MDEVEGQLKKMGKTFAMSKTNEGSISRIYMKFLKVSEKKRAVHTGKSAKAMNRKRKPKKLISTP